MWWFLGIGVMILLLAILRNAWRDSDDGFTSHGF